MSTENNTNEMPENGMEMLTLNIKDLSLSPLNPSTRTKAKRLRTLKANLSKNGQLTPIIVKRIHTSVTQTKNKPTTLNVLRVVDGHRRTHCLQELGHKTVQALVLTNNANYDETFTALHSDTMKISTVQECERWLKGAKCISNRVMAIIGELQEMLGKTTARQVISRCVMSETSPGTLHKSIKKYSCYTGKDTRANNKEIAYWLLNISKPWILVRAIDSFIPVELLLECVDNKVNIPADWAIRG